MALFNVTWTVQGDGNRVFEGSEEPRNIEAESAEEAAWLYLADRLGPPNGLSEHVAVEVRELGDAQTFKAAEAVIPAELAA